MCGRLNLLDAPGVIALMQTLGFPARGLHGFSGDHFNLAPTDSLPVATLDHDGLLTPGTGGALLCPMRWWLTPRWAKVPSRQYSLFNARSETVRKSPAFREAFRLRRAVVPATGFIEWQTQQGIKQPLWIRPPDQAAVGFFAAIWEPSGVDGSPGVAILTTHASPGFRDIHPRMPVLLEEQDLYPWMDRETPDGLLDLLMQPRELEGWQHITVQTSASSPRDKQLQLLDPSP